MKPTDVKTAWYKIGSWSEAPWQRGPPPMAQPTQWLIWHWTKASHISHTPFTRQLAMSTTNFSVQIGYQHSSN